MVPMSRFALMGGTLASALGIGFFMQMSPTAEARYGAGVEVASLAPTLADVSVATDAPDTAAVPTPVPLADMVVETPPALPDTVALAAVDASDTASKMAAAQSVPAAACDAQMTASAQAAAMVRLSLVSCKPATRVTFHHNGMMAQAVTDATGAVDITLPALAEDALFIAEFPDRDGAVASATVTSLADYDRVVLQWRGDAGFMLAAQEFGAAPGEAGHRNRDNPGSIEAAVQGRGGVLTQHGDPALENGLRAESYTFPRGTTQQTGTVALMVETIVAAANCGQEIGAQSLQISQAVGLEVRELVLSMPDCEATGDYIVLNNMAEDLIIAAN